jgi:NADH-ubiquinone oxidoreductase chain 4
MLLSFLLLVPIIGIFLISGTASYESHRIKTYSKESFEYIEQSAINKKYYKRIAFLTSIINLVISLVIYILFDFSNNQFQFVQEHYNMSFFDVYLGIDGISIYFVLLTTIIMPIAILSN